MSQKVLMIAIYLLSLVTVAVAFSPSYTYHVCNDNTTFSRNSNYDRNRDLLLSSLLSNANNNPIGFYNYSAGNQVYGLFLCRGDISMEDCRVCVSYTTRYIKEFCPIGKEAIIWYEECLLRYSDRYIFGVLAQEPNITLLNTQNVSDGGSSEFLSSLASALTNAADDGASAPLGSKRFALHSQNIMNLQTFYTLVQCTPDLSESDCRRCLGDAISRVPRCCVDDRGGRILTPSCTIRYDTYPFNLNAASGPTPGPNSVAKPKGSRISTLAISAIVAAVVVSLVLSSISFFYLSKRNFNHVSEVFQEGKDITAESLQFNFGTIETATARFLDSNKLGEGGFGEVYKGTLANGQEIAVKRLSQSSKQGEEEFKNEVTLVAKLQHRNLVRLLGFCLAGEEKILVYEFVPNKSLDYFLFESKKQRQLNWSQRYKIIKGVARGILYLHEDSRLTIIHRDLKASNVLLDGDMNPKISDFGMARIFGGDQTIGRTKRIVGTYGYMSPEYGMHGQFSVKSDAYSFGILILEIVSGRKNNSFNQTGRFVNFAGYVWKHWIEGRNLLELMDPTLIGDSSMSRDDEVIRCIHIGLLCVQEDPADRPTMATVVTMLNSYTFPLPSPQRPAFYLQSRRQQQDMAVNSLDSDRPTVLCSSNEVSMTEIVPR